MFSPRELPFTKKENLYSTLIIENFMYIDFKYADIIFLAWSTALAAAESPGLAAAESPALATAEENTNGSSTYNLRRAPMSYKFQKANAAHRSHNGGNYSEWLADWNDEFPGAEITITFDPLGPPSCSFLIYMSV